MVFTDYYKTLDIERTATAASIKAAHRTMSKRFHPDVNAADEFYEERFKDVQEAYKVLSDPKSRRLYDRVYRRYSRHGIAAGNVIHIPDDAAGKPAYSWHPDYKDMPARCLLGKRSSLLLGLVIVAITGACAILFLGREPKNRNLVADADVYTIAPRVKQQEPVAGVKNASTQLSEAPEQRTLSIPFSNHAADASAEKRRAQAPASSSKDMRSIVALTQPARHSELSPLLSLPQTVADLPAPNVQLKAMPVPNTVMAQMPDAPADAAPSYAGIDDIMVRRVTQVQYGYMAFVVKRNFLFFGRRPDEHITVRYVSGVRLYKPADMLNKAQLIANGIAECDRIESSLAPTTGDFRMTHAIAFQGLKMFATEGAAQTAIKLEGQVVRLNP